MGYQKTARIIATLDCNRACPYCVNLQQDILKQAKPPLTNLVDLRAYNAVCITGGEPLLYPDKVLHLITSIAQINPRIKTYLYVADYPDIESWLQIFPVIDGLTYTLHSDADSLATAKFHAIQDIIRYNDLHLYKSCRLVIFTGMACTLYLSPWVWTHIEMKPPDTVCKVPSNEQLYLLSSELWKSL